MKAANSWTTYRTRFLVKAKQLTTDLTFTDMLGRQHSGSRGDYLVESAEGVLSIAPRQIFEDIYVPLVYDTSLKLPAACSSNAMSRRIPAPCTPSDMQRVTTGCTTPSDMQRITTACTTPSDMQRITTACTTVEERRFSAASAFPKQHGL